MSTTSASPRPKTAPVAPAVTAAGRLLSLDIFRGATIAGMILVNNNGDESTTYAPLLHSEWNGCTFTDLIFPFFLWIVGVAMTFSFAKRVERGDDRGRLLAHTARRAALIFLLGLILNGFPHYNLTTIRIPGVLQRIAVCYFIAAVIFLYMGLRGRLMVTGALLAGYWILMQLPPGGYERGNNFAAWFDSLFLTGHMWSHTKTWDPEGIISTLPAITNTLFGIFAGMLIRSTKRSTAEKTAWLFVGGGTLVVAGLWLDPVIPINKSIWTSSYALFTSGLASMVFAWFYWLVDVQGYQRGWTFFRIFGMNAIAAYVASGMFARLMALVRIDGVPLSRIVYDGLFRAIATPYNASLLYALMNVLVVFLLVWGMYRRHWFVRL